MKRFLTLFALLPLLGAGCLDRTTPSIPAAKQETPAIGDIQPKESALAFSSSTHAEKGTLYEINYDYPIAMGGEKKLRDNINAAVTEYVATTTGVFKQYLEGVEETENGFNYDMTGGYAIPFNNGRFVSIVFDGYEYTGGAHGASMYGTMVFDADKGERLALADIFSTSTYLNLLSERFHAKLSATSSVTDMTDTDWLKQGTDPTLDNYKYWYLAQDGLHVIFPPYQIAAYAAGDFDLAIPYADLKDALNPEIAALGAKPE